MNLLSACLDLIFPPLCFSCRTRLADRRSFLCSACSDNLVKLENICPVCANQLKNDHCSYCESNNWYFDKVISLFAYTPVVQNLIHALKYRELIRIGQLFKEHLTIFLTEQITPQNIDIITPVPIHRVRKRSRGYNQAELISRAAAEILFKQHLPHLVKRKVYTRTQTKLNREERQQNVSSAFSLSRNFALEGQNILLVDDVFTTGSTVNYISQLLKENGCAKVFVLTLSHA